MKKTQGFTLIELLAVIVLVGIAAAVVTVSVGVGGQSQKLRAETRYLFNGLSAALEEAVITQQQLGLRFDIVQENGAEHYRYQWLILNSQAREWQSFDDEAFSAQELAEDIVVHLVVDGDELIIGGKNKDSFFQLKQSSDSSKPVLSPDIYFLASGEMPDFKITLSEKTDEENRYTIVGNILGQLKFNPDDDDKK